MKADTKEKGRSEVMNNEMSAEERRKFEDLKRRRDNLRRAHKENDSNLYRFLAEQYSDPSHFHI